jgi:long-chain acyl-CoA synthetase
MTTPERLTDAPGFATMSIAAILAETAHRQPDRAALHFMGHTIPYGALWDQTRAYAGALRDRGVGPGDRVAVVIPNVPDFVRVYYAVLALGAVVVPVHLLFKADEIEYVLRDSGATLAVVAAPVLGEAAVAAARTGVPLMTVLLPEDIAAEKGIARLEAEAAVATPVDRHASTSPLDPATILYTSGTTGRPKGAIGTHLNMIEQVNVALLDTFPMTADDVVFGGLPLFHIFGQMAVLNVTFRRGGSIILLPKFDAVEALELMERYGATVFTAVPTMYIGMLQAGEQTTARPPLNFAVSGGAALPVAVLERFQEAFGAPIHEGYGLTETSPTVSFNYVGRTPRPGTVGQPNWGVDVEIADPENDDAIVLLPHGELGEIVVRGYNLFSGYLGRPEATAEAVVDGWFRTGDLGTKDDDDYITIVDRKKDMIVRNGYNVYPNEVEQVLLRHPGVVNAAVFGVADDTHGQEIHAAVIPHDDSIDADELISFVRDSIAAYKFPRVVHLVDELPLGPSGKVLKRELVARYTA